MKNEKRKNKVVVAMSGGVDSSVAATILKRAGFNVIGVFMKFWSESEKNRLIGVWNKCCSPEAEKRARKVAEKLKIPFYVFNFEKEFKRRIVDQFLKRHKEGITPNPCVVCNKEIKFGLLLEKALKLNAEFVATGHYVRKEEVKSQKLRVTSYKVLRGKDREKDQSYFLWQLNQKQLKHILFPIGQYMKEEVRNLAKEFKLPIFKSLNIPESQEICFIKTTIDDFLKKYLKKKRGKIVDINGKILGQHPGLWFYTIGQRKRIGLPGGPYYVLDKDFKNNFLIVTKNEKDLYKKELICKNVNWISGKKPKLPLKAKVKIRYRHKGVVAKIYPYTRDTTYKVRFQKSQCAPTPGQSVVFYRGQELLGGGIIC